MSDIAAAAGVSTLSLDWRGKSWAVRPITNGIKGKFVAWLKSERIKATVLMGPYLTEDGYKAALAGTADALGPRREYDWGSLSCRAGLDSEAGRGELLYLCLADENPGVTREQAAEFYAELPGEVMTVFAALNPTVYILRGGSAEDADPKGAAASTP